MPLLTYDTHPSIRPLPPSYPPKPTPTPGPPSLPGPLLAPIGLAGSEWWLVPAGGTVTPGAVVDADDHHLVLAGLRGREDLHIVAVLGV